MLLCSIDDLEPGMAVGGSVVHPGRPETELLRPGAILEAVMIERLRRIGISQVWVQHDATADLDAAVTPQLSAARTKIYRRLKDSFGKMAGATISASAVHDYRMAIMDLVFQLISSRKYAHLSHELLGARGQLFNHSANVAFLSVLVGLEIETYVVRQRPRLAPEHARDVVPLGLGAMLHDIGKTQLDRPAREHHEIHPLPEDEEHEEDAESAYRRHVELGYTMLAESRMPATARQVVLNHHQRFDGTGWPDLTTLTRGRREGPQGETKIHIFSRIVSAANVLDNLLHDSDGSAAPTVAALGAFAGERYDGWFDPVVRDLVVRRIPPFPIGSLVVLSDGARAVVVSPNFTQPCRPMVRLLPEARARGGGELPTIDLEVREDLHIVQCAGEAVEEHLFELPPLKGRTQSQPPPLAESA
jgi:HD-GYP domain-containing protein (c-di-GMP phosphodiesterase class II)